jgi:hypothetical protein
MEASMQRVDQQGSLTFPKRSGEWVPSVSTPASSPEVEPLPGVEPLPDVEPNQPEGEPPPIFEPVKTPTFEPAEEPGQDPSPVCPEGEPDEGGDEFETCGSPRRGG